LRKIASLALMFILFAAVIITMFRVAANSRETLSAVEAAGPGASFANVDGRKLHYMAWGPESGAPIILVHGTLAWADTFRDIASPLGAMGYRVLAPDLPPFGFSERPAGHDYSRAAQAKRILAFADAVGIERFVLGVHSYGGGGALEAALQAPERISGMVMLDVALGLGGTGGGPPEWLLNIGEVRDTLTASTFTNPMTTRLGLKAFIWDDSVVTPERVALYWKPMMMRGTTGAIGRWLLTGLFKDESKAASSDLVRYKAFEPPVLVIWGKQDSVTPLAQGEVIAAALKNAKLEVLDGVNHIPHVEKPAEVVRLVDGFVKSLPGVAGAAIAASGKGPRLQKTTP